MSIEAKVSRILNTPISRRGFVGVTTIVTGMALVAPELLVPQVAEAQGPDCSNGINFRDRDNDVPDSDTTDVRVTDAVTGDTIVDRTTIRGGEGQLTYNVRSNSTLNGQRSFRANVTNLRNPSIVRPVEANCGFRANLESRSVVPGPTVVPTAIAPKPTPIIVYPTPGIAPSRDITVAVRGLSNSEPVHIASDAPLGLRDILTPAAILLAGIGTTAAILFRHIPVIPGPQGERGERGERGELGERGEPGQRGERGEQGEHGERGELGERGEQGPIGPQSPAGVDINAILQEIARRLGRP